MDVDDLRQPQDDEYVPGEFSGLDEPDYDLERAAREREEWRRLFPEHDAFLRELERTGVAPGTPAPPPLPVPTGPGKKPESE